MSTFYATVRVTHIETWSVEADDARKARTKFVLLTEDVSDDNGGEVVDWEVMSVTKVD